MAPPPAPLRLNQSDDPRRLLFATDFFTNTHTLECYTAALKCGWGLWNLLWCVCWHHHLPSSPLLAVMRELMPQWAWGVVALCLGSWHLLTPIKMIRLRMLWLFAAFCFWVMLTFMVWVAIPHASSLPLYGGLCIVVAVCYLRLYLVHGELFTLGMFFKPLRTWWQAWR